jgi:peptidoglycan/LPS O-acetylase OafA/YrhL
MFADYKEVADPALWFRGIAFLSGFAGQAVILFFVMSGWLVGGGFLKKAKTKPHLFAKYAIDRLTRLWIVLIPLFLMQLWLHSQFGGHSGENDSFSLYCLAGYLLGLQTVSVGEYGNNYPLWSLANETAYYILFPLLIVCLSPKQAAPKRIFAAIFVAAYLAVLTQSIILYFIVWLIGVITSTIRTNGRLSILFVSALFAFSLYMRAHRFDGLFIADASLAVLFALWLSSLAESPADHGPFRKAAETAASFSFTLYVCHVPTIYVFEYFCGGTLKGFGLEASNLAGLLYFTALYIIIIGGAYALAAATEAQTQKVRDKITSWLVVA